MKKRRGRTAFSAVVVGASAGGMRATRAMIESLPATFPVPILVVQHMGQQGGKHLVEALERGCQVRVQFAEDKEALEPGTVYVAPPGYHMLVERNRSLALSVDERLHYARPSIDVLFETAAEAYGASLIGVILSGANADGSAGLRRIAQLGGYCIVQDPATAEVAAMPESALRWVQPDFVLEPAEIGRQLALLCSVVAPGDNGA